MVYEPEHLHRWKMPDSCFGETWPDYYSAGFAARRNEIPDDGTGYIQQSLLGH